METFKKKLTFWFFVVLRLTFVFINNVYCIPTYLLWTVVFLRPLKSVYEKLYWKIENVLYEWLLCMVAAWSWGANYNIDVVGEDISQCYDDQCLVVVNHQSTADVPMLMHLFQGKSSHSRHLAWIMDKMFKWTNFGLVSIIHGDFFISSGKQTREGILDILREYLITTFVPLGYRWLVLFPEGGFLYKRKESSLNYARKNNFPVLNNVSLPKIGAMQEILNTLSEKNLEKLVNSRNVENVHHVKPLKWVIDITLAYPNGQPLDLFAITGKTLPPCRATVHYRYFAASDIPSDFELLTKWMNDRWVEKDAMLEEFYKTGHFPSSPPNSLLATTSISNGAINQHKIHKEPRQVILSWPWIYFLHCFFIASSVFHFVLIRSVFRFVASFV